VPLDVPPPTQVLTLVFLSWACGTAIVAAVSRLWGEIQPGHFKVMWLVSTVLAFAAGFGHHPAWIVAACSAATFAAIYRNLDRQAGVLTLAATVTVLVYNSPLYGLACAAFLGTITNAMLLGHWHLNQPKLKTSLIERLIWGVWLSSAAFLVVTALGATDAVGIGVLGAWTAIAFAAFSGVLTGMVHHLVRTRSIMSATGILYLEILIAFVAVFTGSLAALTPA
jgi:hypothetical protein